jgi:NHLM bacteriocin system ABC transporter peptidase/ATP-binding protein
MMKKVPVIMQMEALECGAAALAMVMACYGKYVPLERLRADCGVSRDGSNAYNIFRAAKAYGLDVHGYRWEPEEVRGKASFPCIVHWEFNHFVVLRGFKGNKVFINDPAKGAYTVTAEAFDKAFTGVCLTFAPTAAFEPGGKPKSIGSFARKRLQGMGGAFAFVVVTTLIAALTGLIMPGFSRVFLDRLLTGHNPEWLGPFIVGLALISLAAVIAKGVSALTMLKITGKFSVTANSSYMWHVLRLPMEFFSQRMAGDITMRQQTNEGIANTLVETLAPLVLNAVMMVFYLVIMLRYSVLLTAVGVASIVINTVVSQVISARRVNITRVQMRDLGKLHGAAVAGIDMMETIKASGAENGFFEKWAGYQAGANAQFVRFVEMQKYLGVIPPLVAQLTAAAVMMLAVKLAMDGRFTAGMIMAFQGFLAGFTAPAKSLVGAAQTIQEMRTDMERVEDVMEYPADVYYGGEAAADKSYAKLSGSVTLRNISFGYCKLDEPLITDFNLDVKPGGHVAIVGPSGCGKSTLSKIISGLYKPWGGELLFDGKPAAGIDRAVLTSSIAVVDQDITLFEDTIGNNIKMWDASIEDFEVIMAARDANLHGEIMMRDGGYGRKILEGGRDLSGGQRQRLEIARVLAQDPTIIILDEATSALDAKTEYEVVKAIKDRGVTCIVIAHRLSTIRDTDEKRHR